MDVFMENFSTEKIITWLDDLLSPKARKARAKKKEEL